MTEDNNESMLTRCEDSTPRDNRNQYRMLGVLALWAVAFVAAMQVTKKELLAEGPMLWLVAVLPVVFGVLVILAYARYLRQADELQCLIHLQALALGFGVGWVALTCYPILELIGAPPMEIAQYAVVMVVFYAIWVLFGRRRYQ